MYGSKFGQLPVATQYLPFLYDLLQLPHEAMNMLHNDVHILHEQAGKVKLRCMALSGACRLQVISQGRINTDCETEAEVLGVSSLAQEMD